MPPTPSWPLPSLSTDSTEAVTCYQRGIVALVGGIVHADSHFALAIAIDPSFFLAHVAMGASLVAAGRPYTPPPSPSVALTRGERQHVEIVDAAFTDRRAHAADLRREHLSEYPCDLLVVWLPALIVQLSVPWSAEHS